MEDTREIFNLLGGTGGAASAIGIMWFLYINKSLPGQKKNSDEFEKRICKRLSEYHDDHIERLDKIDAHLAVQNGRIGKSENRLTRLETLHERK